MSQWSYEHLNSDLPLYFPIENGKYEVMPGLKPFGVALGQPQWDQKLFQIASDLPAFRKNKIEVLNSRRDFHILQHNFDPKRMAKPFQNLLQRMIDDYPETFSFDGPTFICKHTGDKFEVSPDGQLVSFSSPDGDINVKTPWDALALQIAEDHAIVFGPDETSENDWLSHLHVCSPSNWPPEEKIGKSFFDVHKPVAGADKILKMARGLADAMIKKGPYVRFVWSLSPSAQVNLHPALPKMKWPQVNFAEDSPFYFRFERQTVWGTPNENASLFFIRVGFLTAKQVKENPRWNELMCATIHSMSDSSLEYKSLLQAKAPILEYFAR